MADRTPERRPRYYPTFASPGEQERIRAFYRNPYGGSSSVPGNPAWRHAPYAARSPRHCHTMVPSNWPPSPFNDSPEHCLRARMVARSTLTRNHLPPVNIGQNHLHRDVDVVATPSPPRRGMMISNSSSVGPIGKSGRKISQGGFDRGYDTMRMGSNLNVEYSTLRPSSDIEAELHSSLSVSECVKTPPSQMSKDTRKRWLELTPQEPSNASSSSSSSTLAEVAATMMTSSASTSSGSLSISLRATQEGPVMKRQRGRY